VRPKHKIPSFYSVDEVAGALGVSTKTVRRLIKGQDLRAHEIGGQLRISNDDYAAFVAARRR
jgi:excisionase family DNA binding protein